MSKEVTIDLIALKALIQELMDTEVGLRCHIAASSRALTPSERSAYADLLDKAKPQAGDSVHLRFRLLLEACESGKDIPRELSRFLGDYS